MAESVCEQDEVNPAFWLATRAGEMGPPCPLGISRAGPARKKFSLWPYNESLIDRACLVKMAELCPNSFWRFYWPRSTENSKKRLGQYTATVTSRLINNAYIGLCRGFRKPWALESGIQLKEARIRLTIGIQNPSSTDKTNRKDRSPHYQLCGMASRIRNQSTAWTRHNSRLSWISLHGAT